MNLLDALARHLHNRGFAVYDPTGAVEAVDWSAFLESMPASPDRAITLYQYAGGTPDPLLPFDEIRIQVKVRGTEDPTVSYDRAGAIYSALHGLGRQYLPSGLWLQLCLAVQSGPTGLGQDGNGRHSHVLNFDVSITNPTDHRPAL